MSRLLALAAATTATAAIAGLSASAAAQDQGGDKVNTIIIYGDDPCPASSSGEIVVCARMDEGERYRIPESLRESGDPANESWSQRVRAFETVGNTGPLSCTPYGAGGELGCTAQMIETAYADGARGSNVNFGALIAAAREERLSVIDAEAAETQSRVEELERQETERLRAGQEGADEARVAPPSAAPRLIDPARLPPPPGG